MFHLLSARSPPTPPLPPANGPFEGELIGIPTRSLKNSPFGGREWVCRSLVSRSILGYAVSRAAMEHLVVQTSWLPQQLWPRLREGSVKDSMSGSRHSVIQAGDDQRADSHHRTGRS